MATSVATSVGGAPQHVYYNARLSATPQPDSTAPALPVSFIDQRPSPLINKANDYRMSIVRFTATLQSLPALIVEHPTGSTGLTAYTFTIVKNGVSYPGTVEWSPADSSLVPGSGDLFDSYWYEFDFVRFTSFVNQTLSTIALSAGVVAPFFQYDTSTATFSLYTPIDFIEGSGSCELYADTQAHHLFTGLPVALSSTPNLEYRYLMIQQPGESLTTIGSNSYIVRKQIPGSLTSWNPVRRFVFTTQTIPIVPEAIVRPTPFSGAYSGSSLATQNVISDLSPELARGDEFRSGTLEYTPSAQYRYVELISSNPINTIDFNLYWEDQLGGLHLHTLLHNGYVSCKILFEKK